MVFLCRNQWREALRASTRNVRCTTGFLVEWRLLVVLRLLLQQRVGEVAGVNNPSRTRLVMHQFLRSTANESVLHLANVQLFWRAQSCQRQLRLRGTMADPTRETRTPQWRVRRLASSRALPERVRLRLRWRALQARLERRARTLK